MKKLLISLAAASLSVLSPEAAANPPHHHYHSIPRVYHDNDYAHFRLFMYNYNPVYRGPIWIGYDGILRCTRPYYGSVGVVTDDWGRVLTRYNYIGVPRYRLRCR